MYARSKMLLREAGDTDPEEGPIGPSPLEKIRATGEPVSFQSDVAKIKNVVAKVQDSPTYKIGTAALSGGLIGAARAAGMHVPSALAKSQDFMMRPEVTTALGTVIPGAGAVGSAAKGVLGAAKSAGSNANLFSKFTRVPQLDPVAAYSKTTSLVTAPLSGKDPFKK
jgi:hypothetical protein